MRSARLVAALAVSALCAPHVPAAYLARYDFTAAAGNQSFQAPDSAAAGITAQNLTRGAGITAVAGANSINSSGWSTFGSFGPTVADYYQFSVTVQAGYAAKISSLSFSYARSDTGPKKFTVLHSLTNFATVPPAFTGWTGDLSGGGTQQKSLLYSSPALFPDLQNVTGTVTFRVYAYGATNSAGTLRLGVDAANNPFGYAPELVLEGEVTPLNAVPTPPGVGLLAVGAGCVGLVRRWRRTTA